MLVREHVDNTVVDNSHILLYHIVLGVIFICMLTLIRLIVSLIREHIHKIIPLVIYFVDLGFRIDQLFFVRLLIAIQRLTLYILRGAFIFV